jgi:hypothetical protein
MLSKTKILLLNVNRDGWHSGNMIYDMAVIKKACDTKIYGPGWPEFKYTDIGEIIKQLYNNDKPDIIYSYFTPNERIRDVYQKQYHIPDNLMNFPANLDKITDIIKIFAISDFWARSPSQFTKDLGGNVFQYCVSCFTPPYSNPKHFYSFFDDNIRKNIKFLALPRCVDKDCFKDYKMPKKYDVVSMGAMWHFYPLRCFMNQYLLQNAKSLNINYKNYSHCGTDFSHNDFVRDKYARAINESKMLISCGGKYGLAFNKIFESMGCNTLYVGEKPYGEIELKLKDGYNYIAITKDNFIEKIKYYLSKPNEMDVIIKNAKETFETYHHIDARANDFVKLLEKIKET